MLKRIVVKNGKEERQKGASKEPTGKRLAGTLKKQEREAIRGVQKAGVHRSKTVGRTLLLEPKLRTNKRGEHQDFREKGNVKHEQSTDGFKVKGSSCTNKLSETGESIKPANGFLDSPQEHSVASLLKRRSLASSRRQVCNLIDFARPNYML